MPVPDLPHSQGAIAAKDEATAAAATKIFGNYQASVGCSACHAAGATQANTESKIWPDSLSYNATGYGAFPFWDNTGAGCTACDPSVDTASRLSVKYSATLNSELLMHSACGSMSWTGDANAPAKGDPCNHLFKEGEGAFIYTPVSALDPTADGNFCCRTYSATSTNFPGAVPKDWARAMTYWGTTQNQTFPGVYYNGDIKIYWGAGVVDFWYYEDVNGNPIEQGEGCYFPGVDRKTACAYQLPIVLWHDYEPATFKATPHSASEFEVPQVCKTTTVSCAAPDIGRRLGADGGYQSHGPVLTHAARMAGVGRGA